MDEGSLSIAIPTLDRGAVLIETVEHLRRQAHGSEILVVDQTAAHPEEIAARLGDWNARGALRWIRLPEPSIPCAMNVALREARGDVVLFVDDDIVPGDNLGRKHLANYAEAEVLAVAGQVIQPWQTAADVARPSPKAGIWQDLDFPFHSRTRADVRNCIACNFSVRRAAALAAGGFDENFLGAAYRFETEFCRRLTRRGGRIVFDPEASVRHLKAGSGGTRVYGDGIRESRVEHSVGSYYFGYLEASGLEWARYVCDVVIATTLSRHHARHPWKIPRHLLCQLSSLAMARRLYHSKMSRAGGRLRP